MNLSEKIAWLKKIPTLHLHHEGWVCIGCLALIRMAIQSMLSLIANFIMILAVLSHKFLNCVFQCASFSNNIIRRMNR